MSDDFPTIHVEAGRLQRLLILLGSYTFNGNAIEDIDDETIQELRDLLDLELVRRKGMIH